MVRISKSRFVETVLVGAALISLCSATRPIHAQDGTADHGPTNVTVLVKEADTGDAVAQASVTLEFTEPQSFGHGKKHTFNSKTDAQGRCKLFSINKGPITLMVTSPRHQTYGKQLELTHDDQVFEVKLKKPQPLV
jgi:hypothetical protein